MPSLALPFEIHKPKEKQEDSCRILDLLPKQAKQEFEKSPHVIDYLQILPVENYGIPKFHAQLDRSMGAEKNPNLIYPVKESVFVHILHDSSDGRNTYVPLEPITLINIDKLTIEVEKRLLDMAEVLGTFSITTDEEKKKAFLNCIDQICTTKPAAVSNFLEGKIPFGKNANRKPPLQVTPKQLRAIKYQIIRDKIGLGILDPLVNDKYVEDISCSGMGVIFLEHKIFSSLKTTIDFQNQDELDQFVMRLAERIKKPVSVSNPIVDATLPDGSRINIVYGRDVSKRGSNFTIRKFSETPLSINELIDMGTLNYMMAAYLSITIAEGMNVFVCGETASGKTTSLNAVTTFIHPNAKIISIEDTPELQVPHKNWIREVVSSGKEGQAGVGMFDLLKAALRQRPNEIIVGEIRGEEGAIAFQAMQTGHSVMATFHAASVERLIQRLTGSPINVPKSYMDNLNIAIIQQAVKLPTGKMGRRMTSISEIVGYDPIAQSFSFVEIFRWEPSNDSFQFSGDGNSYLLEYKIAPKLGIPLHKKRRIYTEVERRSKILEKLNQQGIKNFYELLSVLAKAQREGLF
jgi:archaeal flagellar protein FlaI